MYCIYWICFLFDSSFKISFDKSTALFVVRAGFDSPWSFVISHSIIYLDLLDSFFLIFIYLFPSLDLFLFFPNYFNYIFAIILFHFIFSYLPHVFYSISPLFSFFREYNFRSHFPLFVLIIHLFGVFFFHSFFRICLRVAVSSAPFNSHLGLNRWKFVFSYLYYYLVCSC